MENSDWLKLKYFSRSEAWGDPNKMDTALVFLLENYRAEIGTPIIITSGTQGRHSLYSYHYQGLAVDCMFPNKLISDIPELIQIAEEMGFRGMGGYCDWELHGVSTPGVHLDLRPTKIAKWIGTDERYLPWNEVNVKRYFLCTSTT